MFRLKVLLLALLVTAPAAAAEQQLAYYVDPLVASMQEYPALGDELSLDTMVPIQKVDGGYLIRVSDLYSADPRMMNAFAFLETKNHYAKGTLLNGKTGTIKGMYKYTALDGFERSIYQIREIGK